MTFLERKIGRKGFMLVETLIVCVFVGVTLVFLFIQLRNITNSYDRSFTYNTASALYRTEKIKRYLETMNFDKLEKDVLSTSKGYIDITSCSLSYYKPVAEEEASFQEYCNLLYQKLKIKKILFSLEDLTNVKYKMIDHRTEDSLSQKMLDFIEYVPYDKEEGTYRVTVEYQDETYASVKMKGSGI